MTKKIKWRLGKLPTPDEVRELVKDKIITQEEAREILFSQEEETEPDVKALESEIKFLRELISKLANRQEIVRTIEVVEKHYHNNPWYPQYTYWCNAGTSPALYTVTGGNTTTLLASSFDTASSGTATHAMSVNYSADTGFDQIKTF